MTREERFDAIVTETGVVGADDDTNVATAREALRQFVLVERNVGSAHLYQSHYVTTHDSLDEAGGYHLGNEYREDWEVMFALDLDTGSKFTMEVQEIARWMTPGGELVGSEFVSRESIIEALREAHRNDSAADAVEYVSDLVGWSAEDDDELQDVTDDEEDAA